MSSLGRSCLVFSSFQILIIALIIICCSVKQVDPIKILNPFKVVKNVVKNTVNVVKQTVENLGVGVGGYVYGDTSVGRLRGTKGKSRIGNLFFAFKGIPYAKAPVGTLRFEAPVAHQGWGGVHDATKFRSQCWQTDIITKQPKGSEDCLFLNVYTRRIHAKGQLPNNNQLRPVIFFIPGGLFMLGGSNTYRPKYFMDEDVVLVTINYRLASFGFLNTGDGFITGNMGLKDQTMALRWVQSNIKYFNGDPSRVTIIGESAGSVSVHLHTLSPMSRGLFARAISQSGTALSPWGLVEEHRAQALEYAVGLGCTTSTPRAMMNCLKNVPAINIARYHMNYIERLVQGQRSLFGPTVEDIPWRPSFIPSRPIDMMKQGNISRTPWINGVNSGEGLVYLISIMRNESMRRILNSRWREFAPILLSYQYRKNKDALSSEVKQYYMKNAEVSQANLKDAVDMISDRNFYLDSHDASILHSRVAPTYAYYYTYQGLFSLGNLLFSGTPLPLPPFIDYIIGTAVNWFTSNILGIVPQSKYGIAHGDELALLFNLPFVRKLIDTQDVDYQLSKKLVRLWVSFAENGKPDPRSAGENVQWGTVQQYNSELREAPLKRLHLDKSFKIIEEPFYGRMRFWKKHGISYL